MKPFLDHTGITVKSDDTWFLKNRLIEKDLTPIEPGIKNSSSDAFVEKGITEECSKTGPMSNNPDLECVAEENGLSNFQENNLIGILQGSRESENPTGCPKESK